jgi:hypothetical protein
MAETPEIPEMSKTSRAVQLRFLKGLASHDPYAIRPMSRCQ